MDEQVLRAVFRGDESVALLIVKPLDFTFHDVPCAVCVSFIFEGNCGLKKIAPSTEWHDT
jgi:hypothetical protein